MCAQPCLGGNSRTVIVATINPGPSHVEETVNTLLFAQRAMAVVNTVTPNLALPPGAATPTGTSGAAAQQVR